MCIVVGCIFSHSLSFPIFFAAETKIPCRYIYQVCVCVSFAQMRLQNTKLGSDTTKHRIRHVKATSGNQITPPRPVLCRSGVAVRWSDVYQDRPKRGKRVWNKDDDDAPRHRRFPTTHPPPGRHATSCAMPCHGKRKRNIVSISVVSRVREIKQKEK